MNIDKSSNHAIVLGGSISGLLSARVLADYFSFVTIIDKDKFPHQPQARKGVPQSFQSHLLLVKGYRILEKLFPKIGTDLSAAGALKIDWMREVYYGKAGWNTNALFSSNIEKFVLLNR